MSLDHNALRKALTTRGVKQCLFAKACGFNSVATVSRIINGWDVPGQRRLEKIDSGLRALEFTDEQIRAIINDDDIPPPRKIIENPPKEEN